MRVADTGDGLAGQFDFVLYPLGRLHPCLELNEADATGNL
jgi:hypothetical protein